MDLNRQKDLSSSQQRGDFGDRVLLAVQHLKSIKDIIDLSWRMRGHARILKSFIVDVMLFREKGRGHADV